VIEVLSSESPKTESAFHSKRSQHRARTAFENLIPIPSVAARLDGGQCGCRGDARILLAHRPLVELQKRNALTFGRIQVPCRQPRLHEAIQFAMSDAVACSVCQIAKMFLKVNTWFLEPGVFENTRFATRCDMVDL
jgi:hypothetical protein